MQAFSDKLASKDTQEPPLSIDFHPWESDVDGLLQNFPQLSSHQKTTHWNCVFSYAFRCFGGLKSASFNKKDCGLVFLVNTEACVEWRRNLDSCRMHSCWSEMWPPQYGSIEFLENLAFPFKFLLTSISISSPPKGVQAIPNAIPGRNEARSRSIISGPPSPKGAG